VPEERRARDGRVPASLAFTAALGVLALAALTSGPLFRVRSWWNFEDPMGEDVPVVVVHALFGVAAIVVLASGGRWRRLDPAALACASALVAWLLATALWSLDRGVSLRNALQVATSLAVGAAVVVVLGWAGARVVLWLALHFGLGWSVVAIYTDRPGTIDRRGDWAGVFVNRNSLALYAALGLVVGAFLAVELLRGERRRWTFVAIGVVITTALVDVRLIAGSDALTPLVAVTATAVVVFAAVLGRRLVARSVSAARLTAAGGVVLLAFAVVAWSTRGAWLDRLGRRGDLTGRSELWSVALDWAWRRPLHGFGYLAAWGDREFLADVVAERGDALDSAHNTIVEVFLGSGLVGVVALVAFVVVLSRNVGIGALTGTSAESLFPLALFAFVAVENLTESLFVGNQLLVALVGALLAVERSSRSHPFPGAR